jgi:hypothetical protein
MFASVFHSYWTRFAMIIHVFFNVFRSEMEELEGADTLSHSAHAHTTTTTNNTSSSTVNANGHQSSAAATSTSNGTAAAVHDGSGSNVTPRGSPNRQNAWNEDETEASFH